MLCNASALIGQIVDGTDGAVGTVSDLLFDDANWGVRWLVVDTGAWLPGRKVLLPPVALGHPDSASRHIPVTLTMKRVKDSPDVDTDMPVSRQAEASIYDHYGWAPYWGGGMMAFGRAMATPFVVPLNMESEPLGLSDKGARSDIGDPHLRSITAVTGYHIHAIDGEIGHAEDFIVDDALWKIRHIVVDTKNWWPGEKVLISPRAVRGIDWSEKLIHLNAKREKIKDSPAYDLATTADGADDALFQTYFGIRLAHA
jgi:hypothetical protein